MTPGALILGSLALGPIQFDRPAWLLLIPILGFICWWLSRGSLSGLGPGTRWAALTARVLVVALLAGALAQPQSRRVGEAVGVMAIVDVSRSIPSDMQAQIDAYIEQAQEGSRRDPDLLGVVTAAERALLQATPSRLVRSVERRFVGGRDATDLGAAVRLALAAASRDAAARIVLISDGNETTGSLLGAAEQARALGVPIDVLPVRYEHLREVMVEELQIPSGVRVGETVSLRTVVTTTGPVLGRLLLFQNGAPVDLSPGEPSLGTTVRLDAGRHVLSMPVTPGRSGAQLYEVVYEPISALDERGERLPSTGDSILENNRATAIAFATAVGAVLLVADTPEEVVPLQDALEASEIATEIISARELPSTLPELVSYDAVVLVNQSAYAVPVATQELLRQYVHDTGGGLVKIGGPDAFGAGGWIGSPLADALPIRMDPPQRRELPMGALALVIDSSGSMAAAVPGTGSTQQQVANEAAVLGVQTMTRLDQITVISFDSSPSVVVPLTPVNDPGEISRRIRSIRPGGGTNMYPAMARAGEELIASNAGVKHMIVLTDGVTIGTDAEGRRVVDRLRAAGITVSTVGVGGFTNDPLLNEIAVRGGGRFYKVGSAESKDVLPQVFIREAQTVRRALIWEGEAFSPARVGVPAEPMRGITGVPPIRGYVVAAEREGLSLVTLRGKENDPISALWQHGLGRVVVFTGDASTRWSPSWVGWAGFRQFWEQHVRWAMRPSDDASLRVVTENRGDQTVVIVEAFDPEGDRLNFARFDARVATPDGRGDRIDLRQVGPGRYEGSFDSSGSGAYVVSMRYRAPGREDVVYEGAVQAAVTRPYADEFRSLRTNTALLRQVAGMTGGRVLPEDPTLAALWTRDGLTMPVTLRPLWLLFLILGAAVFLADVGIRRVRIEPRAIVAWARRSASKERARSSEATEALRSVRTRKAPTPTPQAGAALSGDGATPAAARERAAVRYEAGADRAAPAGPVALAGEEEAPEQLQKKERPRVADDEAPKDSLAALRAARTRARDDMKDR
ncbi:MAG: VWA domain-containing protein [Planctomycetes bacterium]|nr:VWA domain-containing protein [Planctomycetota bacterium]